MNQDIEQRLRSSLRAEAEHAPEPKDKWTPLLPGPRGEDDEMVRELGSPVWRPVVAAAAALVLVIGSGVLVVRDRQETQAVDTSGLAQFVVTDPLAVDLTEAVAVSEGRRMAELGPLLTFDFEQLPSGWVIRTQQAFTVPGETGPGYLQKAELSSPTGARASLAVSGSLYGEFPPSLDNDLDSTDLEVRGQPGQVRLDGTIEWIEQNRAHIQLSGPADSSELLDLVDSLQPVVADLDWSIDDLFEGDIDNNGAERLVGGTIDETVWSITASSRATAYLNVGTPSRTVGRVISETSDPAGLDQTILYDIPSINLDHGVVFYGTAPDTVSSMTLRTDTADIDLPVAAGPLNRVVFGIPLDNYLDPVAIDFWDADGMQLSRIPLVGLGPFALTGGSGQWPLTDEQQEDPPPSPAESLVDPSGRLTPTQMTQAFEACAIQLADRSLSNSRLVDPANADVTVAHPPNQPWFYLVLLEGNSVYGCQMREQGDDVELVIGAAGIGFESDLAATDVRVLVRTWSESFDDDEGSFVLLGQVGNDVMSVEVELSDGTRIAADVVDGWLVADGPVGAGADLFAQRLILTLRDGTTNAANADDLVSD